MNKRVIERMERKIEALEERVETLKKDVGYRFDYSSIFGRWNRPDISVSEKIDALMDHLGLEIARDPSRIVVRKAKPGKKES